ncbi:DUF11 domain-containing protein [Rubellimicrobium rubrum]|uniref:DUF11 domain-containing protein n=1 Tax=Rubellimicrobium rubrum TaxID=2585369 RepID=A0A5C4N6N4_9RHOB|nr:DUF11 domain-containing protein [Rubellimicrobium rubrum]TNC52363.1 DUF11 domain-containing protein [Rubellimicrobium rubrum]
MRFFNMALSAAAALAFSTTLASAQAAPGTTVTNSIDLSYSSGGTTISTTGAATASFRVDRKINLNVTGLDASATVFAEQGANDPVLTFLVDNLGNATQGFDINVASSGALGLTYDPAGTGAEGTFWITIGTTQAVGANEPVYNANGLVNAADLAPNGKFYVHVRANVANNAASGQSRNFDVTATALESGTANAVAQLLGQGLNGVDTVFADPGTDGRQTAAETLRINAPALTASKTVTVISENRDGTFNCANGQPDSGAQAAIPGACIEYTITISNAATATLPARNLTITDALPAGVAFARLDRGGFSTVTQSAGTVTGNLTNLAPGGTASFTIRATVSN